MLRHPGLVAVCVCIVASVGCGGGNEIRGITPTQTVQTATVEFGGRVVNADTGGPVGNVVVSVQNVSFASNGGGVPYVIGNSTGTATLTARR